MHDGRDARIQDRGIGFCDDGANTGAAGDEGVEAQQHERAHDLALDLGAGARGVRANEAALQLLALLGGNLHLRERPKPRRDAVVRSGIVREFVDHASARGDAFEGFGCNLNRRIVARHRDHVVDGQWGRSENHSLLHTSISAHDTQLRQGRSSTSVRNPRRLAGAGTVACSRTLRHSTHRSNTNFVGPQAPSGGQHTPCGDRPNDGATVGSESHLQSFP